MSRLINRIYGRVYGWFDSKEAEMVNVRVPAKFDSRARLLLQNLEDRTVPATFLVTNTSDGPLPLPGSLRQAISDAVAAAGDDVIDMTGLTGTQTISLNTTEAPETAFFLGKDASLDGITINGPTGALDILTVDASGIGASNTIFNLKSASGTPTPGANFTMKNFTVAGGNSTAAAKGGAITMTTQNLTLTSMVLRNNTVSGATSAGAVMIVGAGTLTANSSTFGGASAGEANVNTNTGTSTGQSAAIGSNGAATININNSTIAFNSSSGYSGALGGTTGNLTVTNSVLTDNTASNGGAIAHGNTGGKLSIVGSTLNNNSTNSQGGAIRWLGSTNTVNITNSKFTNNTAGTHGGMLFSSGGSFNITNSTISGNTNYSTSWGGGAMYMTSTALTLTNSVMTGNSSAGSAGGGAIYAWSTATVYNIRNSTISFNSSASNGGAIRLNNASTLNVTNSTIAYNDATLTGGGLSSNGSGILNLDSSIVAANTAAGADNNFGTFATVTANYSAWNTEGGGPGVFSGIKNIDTKGIADFKLDTVLADNNGSGTAITKTIAITDLGSALIDKGRNTLALTTDQRGGGIDAVNFPREKGLTDIGAFEAGVSPLPNALFTNTAVVTKDAGNNPYTFTVKYTANIGNMDRSTIGAGINDITIDKVGGGTGFPVSATFVSADSAVDAPVITATYKITPPTDNIWDSTDNGSYTISIDLDGVKDKGGQSVPDGVYTTFTVNAVAPTATLTSAPEVKTSGGMSYSFQVTYTDANAILASTVHNNTTLITVTGPGGPVPVDTAVSVPATNGSPLVVTYTITPPAAPTPGWDSDDNGYYTLSIAGSVVTNVNPGTEFIAGGDVGKFRVAIPTTLMVTNNTDSGPGSLRQAIVDANALLGPANIVFDPAYFTTGKTVAERTIVNLSPLPAFTLASDVLSITGPTGAGTAMAYVDANDLSRHFDFSANAANTDISISNLTLTNSSGTGAGGSILIGDENVTLSGVTISATSTTSTGGAVSVGSGGRLTMNNSIIDGTSAGGNGGAVYFGAGGSKTLNLDGSTIKNALTAGKGGAIFTTSNAVVNVNNSSVTGNTATSTSYGGGFIYLTATALTVTNSTISGNSSAGTNGGGAIYAWSSPGSITITNSTISSNTGSNGGAIRVNNSAYVTTISNSTIVDNSAVASTTAGGGLSITSGATVTLNSTVVARNSASAATPNDFNNLGTINANYSAWSVTPNGTVNNSNSNLFTLAEMNIAPSLASNGGPTKTYAIGSGKLVDAGSNTLGLTYDQRGTPYNRVELLAADIGAFERVPGIPTAAGGPYTTIDQFNYLTQDPYVFTVTYANDSNISSASVAASDVKVNGTNLSNKSATFVSQSPGGDAVSIVATYQIAAPALGGWVAADNGSYTITVQGGIVSSGSKFVATTTVGSFLVAIPNTFMVTNNNDSGAGSLRQAILDANAVGSPDKIVFDPAYFTTGKTVAERTIVNLSALPAFTLAGGGVTIIGPTGAGTAPAFVDANDLGRHFDFSGILPATAVSISDLTLTNSSVAGAGGSIVVGDEYLTLNGVTISAATATATGGAISVGSGGRLTMNNSVIDGASASGSGGAVYFGAGGSNPLNIDGSTIKNSTTGGYGGAIFTTGGAVVNVNNSSVSGNTSNGTSWGGGFIYLTASDLTVTNSTISGNSSAGGNGGGAIYAWSSPGSITITNSTISSNTGTNGGAIRMNSSLFTTTISNSTIVDNSAVASTTAGGGLSITSGATVTLNSTVVARNSASGATPNDFNNLGTINANYSAWSVDPNGTVNNSNSNLFTLAEMNIAPALSLNGGATQTYSIGLGKLVDAGSNTLSLTYDQRGTPYNRVEGVAADIGAFERVPGIPSASGGPYTTITKDATFNPYTFTVTYIDDVLINLSTVGNGDGKPDIVVNKVGGGYSQNATFVSADKAVDSQIIVATYTITPTGDGLWDSTDNGSYEIRTLLDGVKATSGKSVPDNFLVGTIAVNAQAPTAKLNTALDISTPGGTTYSFTVDYTDANAIAVATIQNQTGIVTVEGPNLFTATITSASVDINTNGTPRTVTYTFTTPGGSWDGGDNGVYTIKAVGGTVTNVAPGTVYVPASTLGTFTCGIPIEYLVTNTMDSGVGSLRDAITAAEGDSAPSLITFSTVDGYFDVDNTKYVISLLSPLPAITQSVTINGINTTKSVVDALATGSVLDVSGSAPNTVITISGLALTGGSAANGGGMVIGDENVTLNNVSVSGNTAVSGGGGIVAGTGATLTLNSSLINNNSAGTTGGGIRWNSGTAKTLTISSTTISNNTASGTGGGGGIFASAAKIVVDKSTISGNTHTAANYGGGGLYAVGGAGTSFVMTNSTVSGNSTNGGLGGGGGLYFWQAPATYKISNSTIANNTAPLGGGIGFSSAGGTVVDLINSTIVDNLAVIAAQGGGISTNGAAQTINLNGTVFARNMADTSDDDFNDIGTSIVNASYSAWTSVYTPNGIDLNNKANISLVDLAMGTLANNGGPTQTAMIGSASKLLDANDPVQSDPYDQRGFSRVVGGTADIGAVERKVGDPDVGGAPVVSGIVVNDGAVQRSRLVKVVVNFTTAVDLAQFSAPGVVYFKRVGIATNNVEPLNTIVDNASGLLISPSSGTGNSITLTFDNIDNAGVDYGSLSDGRWELYVNPASYVGNSGNTGDDLRRLFGNINNDTLVDASDFGFFPSFGAAVDNPFDFNNNGDIDGAIDFSEFGNRFGFTLV